VKTILKEAANPAVPAIKGLGVTSVQDLDFPAQRWFPEGYEQVIMASHQAVAKKRPAEARHRYPKSPNELFRSTSSLKIRHRSTPRPVT
jgi:hypothetical protein